MHAVLLCDDGRLRWSRVPDPVLGEDDVLLEVHAAALNRADLLQRAGQYPPPAGWPEWFGLEAAGIIRDMGEAARRSGKWHVGDAVCALLGGGGYAEYVAVPAGMLMPIPRGLSMEEAASLPEVFASGYLFLAVEGRLQRGETLLVRGGTSGLATAVIPMARAMGARVVTTIRGAQAVNAIRHLHADRVVDTQRESLPDVMREELAAGRGIDVAVDCLGGAEVGECLPLMNTGGRWIMIATLSGDVSGIDLRSLYARRVRLIGTTLRSRTPEEKAGILQSLVSSFWPMLESGEIRPVIRRSFPIQEAEEAQALMAAGGLAGKIVLRVR